jgi:hypothetical protein
MAFHSSWIRPIRCSASARAQPRRTSISNPSTSTFAAIQVLDHV